MTTNYVYDENPALGIALVGSRGSEGIEYEEFHYEPLEVCRYLTRHMEGNLAPPVQILHQMHTVACIKRDKADKQGLVLGPYQKPAKGWIRYDKERELFDQLRS